VLGRGNTTETDIVVLVIGVVVVAISGAQVVGVVVVPRTAALPFRSAPIFKFSKNDLLYYHFS